MEVSIRSGTLRTLIADGGGPLFIAAQVLRELTGYDPRAHFGSVAAAQVVVRVKSSLSDSEPRGDVEGVVRPLRR